MCCLNVKKKMKQLLTMFATHILFCLVFFCFIFFLNFTSQMITNDHK